MNESQRSKTFVVGHTGASLVQHVQFQVEKGFEEFTGEVHLRFIGNVKLNLQSIVINVLSPCLGSEHETSDKKEKIPYSNGEEVREWLFDVLHRQSIINGIDVGQRFEEILRRLAHRFVGSLVIDMNASMENR